MHRVTDDLPVVNITAMIGKSGSWRGIRKSQKSPLPVLFTVGLTAQRSDGRVIAGTHVAVNNLKFVYRSPGIPGDVEFRHLGVQKVVRYRNFIFRKRFIPDQMIKTGPGGIARRICDTDQQTGIRWLIISDSEKRQADVFIGELAGIAGEKIIPHHHTVNKTRFKYPVNNQARTALIDIVLPAQHLHFRFLGVYSDFFFNISPVTLKKTPPGIIPGQNPDQGLAVRHTQLFRRQTDIKLFIMNGRFPFSGIGVFRQDMILSVRQQCHGYTFQAALLIGDIDRKIRQITQGCFQTAEGYRGCFLFQPGEHPGGGNGKDRQY